MATSITDVIADTVENWLDGKGSHPAGALARRTGRKDWNAPSIGTSKHKASMLAFKGGAARQD